MLAVPPLFNNSAFRGTWIAMLLANLAANMHEFGIAWLMTASTASPLMVGLSHAASTLPIFLLALPAGALADDFDRVRLLALSQWLAIAVLLSIVLAVAIGGLGPIGILGLAFAFGCCTALRMPAQSSLLPDLVSRSDLGSALSISGLALHGARTLGPVIAGALALFAGPVAVFAGGVVALVGSAALLFGVTKNRKAEDHRGVRTQGVFSQIRAGLSFAVGSREVAAISGRGVLFFLCAACPLTLLPILTHRAGGGPDVYGLMLAFMGGGAAFGALVLRWLAARIGIDERLTLGYVAATASCILMLRDGFPALFASAAVSGLGGMLALTTLQVCAQAVLPNWVRARGLAIFQMCFMGSAGVGSILWGWIATGFGLNRALLTAAAIAAVGVAVGWWLRLAPLIEAKEAAAAASIP